jgi:folate-dependent phosphoribosylglycinamide formyltransferase PurN
MPHRIAFLYNYPLADNTVWKQQLFRALHGHHTMLVVFGKTRVMDYLRTYLRQRQENDVQDLSVALQMEPRKRTIAVANELGIPVRRVRSLNSAACARILGEFRPDYVVTALDHLLSKSVIAAAPTVLNVHYGVLPDVKGWNATEWSLLVTGRLSVSLHRVVCPVDSGEIFLSKEVEVERTDGMASLRAKCQSTALQLYIEFFRDPANWQRLARPNDGGKTYYVMNRLLKQQVLGEIRSGRFDRREYRSCTGSSELSVSVTAGDSYSRPFGTPSTAIGAGYSAKGFNS